MNGIDIYFHGIVKTYLYPNIVSSLSHTVSLCLSVYFCVRSRSFLRYSMLLYHWFIRIRSAINCCRNGEPTLFFLFSNSCVWESQKQNRILVFSDRPRLSFAIIAARILANWKDWRAWWYSLWWLSGLYFVTQTVVASSSRSRSHCYDIYQLRPRTYRDRSQLQCTLYRQYQWNVVTILR